MYSGFNLIYLKFIYNPYIILSFSIYLTNNRSLNCPASVEDMIR